jgi:hypothetical protein
MVRRRGRTPGQGRLASWLSRLVVHHCCGTGHAVLPNRRAHTGCQHRAVEGDRLLFDRQEEGRTKTGLPASGTLSRRTQRLVTAYQKKLGAELHPDAILFHDRSKAPYREGSLADDFAAVCALVFPGRRLMDLRRSGTIEAIVGGADITAVAAKIANSLDRSSELHRTYAPVDLAAVHNADEARCAFSKHCPPEN